MDYEYNSNLEFEERVALVSKEIKTAYSYISDKSIMEAAILANVINDYVTNDNKFDRLYHILLVLNKNKEDSTVVFNDIYNIYEAGLENKMYNDMMVELINYYSGERDTFPYMSEVM